MGALDAMILLVFLFLLGRAFTGDEQNTVLDGHFYGFFPDLRAASRDLAQMIAERQFRNDLYYRLNVFPIRVPALRERAEDIPLLVRHFVNKYAREMNKRIETVPPVVMHFLRYYHWPG